MSSDQKRGYLEAIQRRYKKSSQIKIRARFYTNFAQPVDTTVNSYRYLRDRISNKFDLA